MISKSSGVATMLPSAAVVASAGTRIGDCTCPYCGNYIDVTITVATAVVSQPARAFAAVHDKPQFDRAQTDAEKWLNAPARADEEESDASASSTAPVAKKRKKNRATIGDDQQGKESEGKGRPPLFSFSHSSSTEKGLVQHEPVRR